MARIGLIQMDILWEDVAGNVAKVKQLLAGGGNQAYDLLVLPELWSCGFTMNLEAHHSFQPGFDCMQELSQRYRCPVLGGLPAKTPGGQENRCYLVHAGKSGYYAKLKAFKFAGEHLKYEQGTQSHRWPVAGFKLSPFICYDLRFPELSRSMLPETNLITYVANWPSVRVNHWRLLLQARAVENLSYVIGVNRVGSDGAGLDYSGASMVVSPAGDILLDAGDREGVFTVEIEPEEVKAVRARWPFLNDM